MVFVFENLFLLVNQDFKEIDSLNVKITNFKKTFC